jgi:hypothetical protein
MREWAASIPAQARSIAGTWWEKGPYTLLNVPCGSQYTISVSSNGEFKMQMASNNSGILCDFDGTLVPKGDGLAGNATRTVITPDLGTARQGLGIYLEISDDLETITGIATGGKIRRFRNFGDGGEPAYHPTQYPSGF